MPVRAVLVHQERSRVRCDDGRVDDQEENQPVPRGFQRRVVENDRSRDATAVGQAKIGHDVVAQGKDLRDRMKHVVEERELQFLRVLRLFLEHGF